MSEDLRLVTKCAGQARTRSVEALDFPVVDLMTWWISTGAADPAWPNSLVNPWVTLCNRKSSLKSRPLLNLLPGPPALSNSLKYVDKTK